MLAKEQNGGDGDLQVHGKHVYYTTKAGLSRIATTGGPVEIVTKGEMLQFAVAGTFVYWQGEDDVLMRAPLAGGQPESTNVKVEDYKVVGDGTHVYFTGEDEKFYRLSPKGSPEVLLTRERAEEPGTLDTVKRAAATTNLVVVGGQLNRGLDRIDVEKPAQVVLKPQPETWILRALAMDGTHAYFSAQERFGSGVWRVGLNGPAEPEKLSGGDMYEYAEPLGLGPAHVYWEICGNDDKGRLMAVKKSGGKVETLLEEAECISAFAVADKYIYWRTRGTKESAYHDAAVKRMRVE